MKKTTLFINTSNSNESFVVIDTDGNRHEYREKTISTTKSQNILPLIQTALQKEKLTLNDLTEIKVHPGPGSFTGVRVGVTVANALGWTLGIPVNGKKIEIPHYSQSKFD